VKKLGCRFDEAGVAFSGEKIGSAQRVFE